MNTLFITLSHLLLVIFIFGQENIQGCFEDKCYTIFTPSHGLNWHESQSRCVEWGGNLASIESDKENEFILEKLGAYDEGNCWIGLNDVEEEAWYQEADFTWIDSSISTYRHFKTGEPNDWDNSEDCVHLLDKTTPKSWNDGKCSTRFRCYICKKIVYFGRDEGGSFHRLHNLSVINPKSNLFCQTTAPSRIQWTFKLDSLDSGISLTSTSQWFPSSQRSISYLRTSQFGFYTCHTVIGRKQSMKYTVRVATSKKGAGCRGDKCFEVAFTPHAGVDWQEARSKCMSWGGDLASIRSADEERFMLSLGKSHYGSCWIGHHDRYNEAGNNATLFVSLEGSLSLYRNFDTAQPDQSGNEDCVHLRRWNQDGWNDLSCDDKLHCYVCAKSRCKDLSCFQVFTPNSWINWTSAESNCEKWGGSLASIRSEPEEEFLLNLITESDANCWVGLTYPINSSLNNNPNLFEWRDDSQTVYRHFHAELSDTIGRKNSCVFLSKIHKSWFVSDCNAVCNCYICRKSASRKVHFSPKTPNPISILLLPPEQEIENDIKRHNLITYNGKEIDIEEKSITVSDPETNQTYLFPIHGALIDLMQGVEYNIKAKILTSAGGGPYSSFISVTTTETAPSSLTLRVQFDGVYPTKLEFNWTPPDLKLENEVITGYLIQYHGLLVDTDERTLTTENRNSEISNLEEGSAYEISICAFTDTGMGPCLEVVNRTEEITPGQTPQNVTVEVSGSTALLVSWNHLLPKEENGIILYYLINIEERGLYNSFYKKRINSIVTYFMIENLQRANKYSIRLCAVNNAGNGPYSDVITVETYKDLPSASPQGVFGVGNTNLIIVIWDLPLQMERNGVITHYQVTYRGMTIDSQVHSLNETALRTVIPNLQEGETYQLKVRAYTSEGPGPYSPILLVKTFEREPTAPPRNFTIAHVSSSSIRAVWQEPLLTEQNGVIIGYDISIEVTRTQSEVSVVRIGDMVRSYTSRNLNPNTKYSMKIRAVTQPGAGPYSLPVIITTLSAPVDG